MRRSVFFYVMSFFVILAVIFSLFPPMPARASESDAGEVCRLFLSASEDGDVIEVIISLESRMGVCALLSYLEYNADSLLFLSGGAELTGFNCKCIDFGGCVGLLIDSPENSPASCVLVRLYFKRIGDGEEKFSLACKENGAIYLDGGGDMAVCRTEALNMIQIGDKENAGNNAKPELICFEKNERGGRMEFCFSVKVGEGCFAGGVRLFCVDLGGRGRHFSVYLVGVVGKDGFFTGRYAPDNQTDYAVIVTAVGYKRNRTEAGEKTVTVLSAPQ